MTADWKYANKELPPEQCAVFVVCNGLGGRQYLEKATFVKNLHQYNDWNFPDIKTDSHPGFILTDSEWGDVELTTVVYWDYAPELPDFTSP